MTIGKTSAQFLRLEKLGQRIPDRVLDSVFILRLFRAMLEEAPKTQWHWTRATIVRVSDSPTDGANLGNGN